MKAMKNPDHDAWLINGADDPKGTVYEDERYEIIKDWLELSDEEMAEIDLDEKWDSYLEWKEECRVEYIECMSDY